MKQSTINKREKKTANRDAKTTRKAANKVEEKKNTPNNLLLGILIFGIILSMFVIGGCIKYFQKDATIESYLEKNKDTYAEMVLDDETTAYITAKRNNMNYKMVITTKDKDLIKEVEEYYGDSEDGRKNLKYLGAYYLSAIKPETRALFSDVHASIVINDEEIAKTYLTCYDADRIIAGTYYNGLEKQEKESVESSAVTDGAQTVELVTEDLTGDNND